MSRVAAWDDARSRLESAGLGVPIHWPNEPFILPEPPALWVSVDMTGDFAAPIELGPNGAWQEDGELVAHVYAPTGTGTRDARVLAGGILDTFRGLLSGAVAYTSGSIGNGVTEETDGAWWRLTVTVAYRYQDHVE